MTLEDFRDYCLAKKGVEETFPFDGNSVWMKVMGKMFALASLETVDRINLKCDPDYAIELREKHAEDILPGWHMNKVHWNTVMYTGGLTDKLILHLIRHSYELVVSKLPKKVRVELAEME